MIEEIKNTSWDIVVVGTGIGGGTLGYALAKAGKKVLFIEKGRAYFYDSNISLTGDYAEHFQGYDSNDFLCRAGRWNEKIGFGKYKSVPFLGVGTGGSSAIYGMLMERFMPVDFKDWPVTYEEMALYYAQAEQLYRVKGAQGNAGQLPLPPEFSPANKELYDFLNDKGMHPKHVPMACEYVDKCRECIGFICNKNCKNDSVKICLKPAVEHYSAKLLAECELLSLNEENGRITSINCRKNSEEFTIKTKLVALAAGAIQTPAILLRCGLANSSNMVGKNLMRHFVDLYSIETKSKVSEGELTKQISFNDLYIFNGIKLGNVQALGNLPHEWVIAKDVAEDIKNKLPVIGRAVATLAFPFIKNFARKKMQNKIILAGIMEDLPYKDNSVSLAKDGSLAIKYTLKKEAKERLVVFRKKIKEVLYPYKFTFIASAHNNERLAHVCGTCRAGNDPKISVVDKNNKAHDISNLYIVDSSFFPSSAGTNPSLTIAANALRVAEHIIKET